jgi:HK97 family phage portal protein
MGTISHLREAGRHLLAALPFVGASTRFGEGKLLSDPSNALAAVGGLHPGTKIPVTEANALTISAVWAAVRVISGGVGVLPLKSYERLRDGTRDEIAGGDTDPAPRLASQPNSEMTPVTFWETIVSHVLTWGNGYAEIERNGAGQPIGLWPLLPNRVKPDREKDGRLIYKCRDAKGAVVDVDASDIFHIPGLGFDGLRGYSPVAMARRSLGITAATEEAGEGFFGDGMRPGGVLKYPGTLKDLQQAQVEAKLKETKAGAKRFGSTLVLYGGMEWEQLSIPPNDAQFLETRTFQIGEVARWFNLPPHKLRELSRATFSNIEHQGLEFISETLLYWLTKITQEFNRKILTGNRFVEHVLDVHMRADTIGRYTAYGLARHWGILSSNDVRRKENLAPREGGNDYLTPVNMAVNGRSIAAANDPSPPSPTPPSGRSTSRADDVAILVATLLETECKLFTSLVGKAGEMIEADADAAVAQSISSTAITQQIHAIGIPLSDASRIALAHRDRLASFLFAAHDIETPLADAEQVWRMLESRHLARDLMGVFDGS